MEVLHYTFKVIRCMNRSILSTSSLKYQRSIVTTTMNVNKVEEELKSNPYFEKYAGKIAKLQKISPEEYLSRLETIVDDKRKGKKVEDNTDTSKSAFMAGKAKAGSPLSYTKSKVLDDILKVDLIMDKPIDDIKLIWTDYHKNKNAVSAIIPVATYDLIMERSNLYPIFLLPLPRNQGYEFIVCQFAANEVHFTPLISYQTHKENAPECLSIVYYGDIRKEKNIVLMRGEYNKEIINSLEAQCLANELQLYYGEENDKRTKLLERFTNHPEEFKHMDLVANLETLSF